MRPIAAVCSELGSHSSANEDNFILNGELGLFAVFDGMGGHAAGEVASRIASEQLAKFIHSKREELKTDASKTRNSALLIRCLEEGMHQCGQAIFQHASSHTDCRGMGTTAIVLLVKGMRGVIASVGDSRIYRLRAGKLEQLSRDHTMIQELIDQGIVKPDAQETSPYRHVLSRVIGMQEGVQADVISIDLIPGDRFLLCTDGVSDTLSETEISKLLDLDPKKASETLAEKALAQGSADDRTAMVVHIDGAAALSAVEKRLVEQVTLTNEILQRMKFFSDLTPNERARVIEHCTIRTCDANEYLMREGEPGDTMYVILRGKFEVSHDKKVIAQLNEGNHVGEIALLSGDLRTANVKALTEADLLCLGSTDFKTMLNLEPRIGVKMLLALSKELGARLGAMNQTR